MFKYIRTMIKRQILGFKFGFLRANLINARNPIGSFTAIAADGNHIVAVYMADKLTSMLHVSSSIPSVVISAKPKHDTMSTIGAAFFCNQAFLSLPENEKTAIYVHELGHLINHHLDDPKNLVNGVLNGNQFELEADMFAIQSGHVIGLYSVIARIRNAVTQQIEQNNVDRDIYGNTPEVMIAALDERLAAMKKFYDSAIRVNEQIHELCKGM